MKAIIQVSNSSSNTLNLFSTDLLLAELSRRQNAANELPPAQSLLQISETETEALRQHQKLLAPHHNSGRGKSIYFVFKVLGYGCIKYERYNPTLVTIGRVAKEYGYNKALGKRKTGDLVASLVIAGLITRKRVGRLYRYSLTKAGEIAYHYIVDANKGDKYIRLYEPPEDLSTIAELVESLNKAEEKKVQLSEPEKCITYIDYSYTEDINNIHKTNVCSLSNSKKKNTKHIDGKRLDKGGRLEKEEILKACDNYSMPADKHEFVVNHMQTTKGIDNKAAYLANMLRLMQAGDWGGPIAKVIDNGYEVARKSFEATQKLFDELDAHKREAGPPPEGVIERLRRKLLCH